jgi:hypothetical protein
LRWKPLNPHWKNTLAKSENLFAPDDFQARSISFCRRRARLFQGAIRGTMIDLNFRATANRAGLLISDALTIKSQSGIAPVQGSHAMISELRRLIALPIAMILFLCAASTSPGLTWRTNEIMQTAYASR